jgi:hypothetical protein
MWKPLARRSLQDAQYWNNSKRIRLWGCESKWTGSTLVAGPAEAKSCVSRWAPRRNHTVLALVREIMTTVNCQNVLRTDYEIEVYVLPGDKENTGIVWCETCQLPQPDIVISIWYHTCKQQLTMFPTNLQHTFQLPLFDMFHTSLAFTVIDCTTHKTYYFRGNRVINISMSRSTNYEDQTKCLARYECVSIGVSPISKKEQQPISTSIFSRVHKVSKSGCYLRKVCPSVHPSIRKTTLGSSWTDFREILDQSVLLTSVVNIEV